MTCWCVISCWSFEASLSGYDDNDEGTVHPTREAALEERDRLARELIGTVDGERWCIGVGIAPEVRPGVFDYPDQKELEWADRVPEEVLAWES